jgi:hypothetical protein
MITSETFVVVYCGEDLLVHPKLVLWLMHEGFQPSNIYWHRSAGYSWQADFNHGIKVAIESGKESLMFCDCDMQPTPALTSPFLADIFDLQCIKSDTGTEWREGSFHTGMWRTGRRHIVGMTPPWLEWQVTDDGCEVTGCLCKSLADKYRARGLTVGVVGEAGHVPKPKLDNSSLVVRF